MFPKFEAPSPSQQANRSGEKFQKRLKIDPSPMQRNRYDFLPKICSTIIFQLHLSIFFHFHHLCNVVIALIVHCHCHSQLFYVCGAHSMCLYKFVSLLFFVSCLHYGVLCFSTCARSSSCFLLLLLLVFQCHLDFFIG